MASMAIPSAGCAVPFCCGGAVANPRRASVSCGTHWHAGTGGASAGPARCGRPPRPSASRRVEEAMVEEARMVAELGTLLGIWAHPDDEAYLSGGLMALARDVGSRVTCVTATRGELGTPDPQSWPSARLAVERTDELRRSLEILGVGEHHWLGYQDGRCADVDAAVAVGELCALIADVRPQTVLTFGPDGQTGHPDHRAVSAWVTEAFDRAAPYCEIGRAHV